MTDHEHRFTPVRLLLSRDRGPARVLAICTTPHCSATTHFDGAGSGLCAEFNVHSGLARLDGTQIASTTYGFAAAVQGKRKGRA